MIFTAPVTNYISRVRWLKSVSVFARCLSLVPVRNLYSFIVHIPWFWGRNGNNKVHKTDKHFTYSDVSCLQTLPLKCQCAAHKWKVHETLLCWRARARARACVCVCVCCTVVCVLYVLWMWAACTYAGSRHWLTGNINNTPVSQQQPIRVGNYNGRLHWRFLRRF